MRSQLAATFILALPVTGLAQITTGGYVDLYGQTDIHQSGASQDLPGRAYDPKHESIRLAVAEFDATLPALAGKRLGFTTNLLYGESTNIQFGTEPGGTNKYKNVGQAYVTAITKGAHPLTVDFGEFYTFIGYEGFDSRLQDNYGRSFLYTLMQPNYHFGLRASAPIDAKTTATVYVVNGWNEIKDGNGEKSFGGTLTATMSPKLTMTLSGYTGMEGSPSANDAGSFGGIGLPTPGTARLNMADFIATYQAKSDLKFAVNADYASLSGAGAAGWNGVAVYARKTYKKSAFALRLETVQDAGGLRAGTPMTLRSATATFDVNVDKTALTRLELRRDDANTAYFPSSDGPRKDRTTLTAALILKF